MPYEPFAKFNNEVKGSHFYQNVRGKDYDYNAARYFIKDKQGFRFEMPSTIGKFLVDKKEFFCILSGDIMKSSGNYRKADEDVVIYVEDANEFNASREYVAEQLKKMDKDKQGSSHGHYEKEADPSSYISKTNPIPLIFTEYEELIKSYAE